MSLSETYARNLRVRMAVLGYKTSDLHRLTGISITTLIALQNGNNKGVQFGTTEKIAKALRMDPYLLYFPNTGWAKYKWSPLEIKEMHRDE